MPGTKTRARDADVTREALLRAALAEFSRHNFKTATVRAVAKRARVNHAVIRYHFGSKDELWREAVRYLFERQIAELDFESLYGQGLDDHALLREGLARYVRYSARHPEHARIAVQESIAGGTRLRWMARNYIRAFHANMAPPLERLMEAGALPKANVISTIYLLAHAAHSVFLLAEELRVVHGQDPYSDAFVEAHVDAVLALIARA